jgi:hypothetical protein
MIDYVVPTPTLFEAFEAAYDQANEELARVDTNLNRLKLKLAAQYVARTYPHAALVRHCEAFEYPPYTRHTHVAIVRPNGYTAHRVCNGALGAVAWSYTTEATQ